MSTDIVVSRDVSEFEDEIVVTFWREEGVVPVEVLEGMNGGEGEREIYIRVFFKGGGRCERCFLMFVIVVLLFGYFSLDSPKRSKNGSENKSPKPHKKFPGLTE